MRTNKNTLGRAIFPAAVLSGALVLSACSGGENGGEASQTAATSTSSQRPSQERVVPYIRFDALGGNSPIIETRKGFGESSADREKTGRTYNGAEPKLQGDPMQDEVVVNCYTPNGREVSSQPPETAMKSTGWYGFNGKTEFVPDVYADIVPPSVNSDLPPC